MTPLPVAAVVPTFRPDVDVVDRLRELSEQVTTVVVADDGSGAAYAEILAELESIGCVVLRDPVNRGIAAALNRGIDYAIGMGAAFVLTVDQDSTVRADYVRSAIAALQACGDEAGLRTAVVAGRVDGTDAQDAGIHWAGEHWELLQSGLFVSTELIRLVGWFDEALFIDCVDTEWGLRAVTRGARFAVADACVLDHGAGVELSLRVPLRGDVRFSVHAPVRRFYITRNRVLISRRFALQRPRWFLWQTRSQVQIALLGIVTGPHRRAQVTAAIFGLISGLSGRSGPIPRRLQRSLQS